MRSTTKSLTPEQKIIRNLSDRIVAAQKPIRILDAVKWAPHIQADFLKHKCKKLPAVDEHYYEKHPLPFDPSKKTEEFYEIERDINRQLGQFSGIGSILLRICREYRSAVRMLDARGTADFYKISSGLYGSTQDAFYANGPTLADLGKTLENTLGNIKTPFDGDMDKKCYSSTQAVKILKKRLDEYFNDPNERVTVKIDDGVVADAAAGADIIKIRRDATFSERDLRILEVHEGWVHVGTTLNGRAQPICTFLSKGPPTATIFQEGLAVITEIFSFTSHPNRIQRLTNRIASIKMAEAGADFLEVFHFFQEQGLSEVDSYKHATRVFRGSTPKGKPFTKDLAYNKGFILIYNYIRLAIKEGKMERIPLLFLGKTSLEDLHIYEQLLKEGTLTYPKYVIPYIRDMAGLTCWMAYSLFLNKLDLNKLLTDYKMIL